MTVHAPIQADFRYDMNGRSETALSPPIRARG